MSSDVLVPSLDKIVESAIKEVFLTNPAGQKFLVPANGMLENDDDCPDIEAVLSIEGMDKVLRTYS